MFGNYVNIRKKHLDEYKYCIGGGMTGGYIHKQIKKLDNQALIRLESAEWHSQEPTVTEYHTDVMILDEIEAIVRKYKMNFWNRKKFTGLFIHDGESTSYSFVFNDVSISFSSQLYPLRFKNKLEKIDEILDKYLNMVEKIKSIENPDTNN